MGDSRFGASQLIIFPQLELANDPNQLVARDKVLYSKWGRGNEVEGGETSGAAAVISGTRKRIVRSVGGGLNHCNFCTTNLNQYGELQLLLWCNSVQRYFIEQLGQGSGRTSRVFSEIFREAVTISHYIGLPNKNRIKINSSEKLRLHSTYRFGSVR